MDVFHRVFHLVHERAQIDYDRIDRTIYWRAMNKVRLNSDVEIVSATIADQMDDELS